MEQPRLEVVVYKIHPPELWARTSADGTGWAFGRAELERDWMDATSQRYAYRCLPLSIANQVGLWILNPVGFTAVWHGQPDRMDITFDRGGDVWKRYISNHFSNGVISWNSPVFVRTRPKGSRLLVSGPPNYIKPGAHPLTGLIETDWSQMSFTMNWRLSTPKVPVRFEQGDPILHLTPLARNTCADLEEADIVFKPLESDPEIERAYKAFAESRSKFLDDKAKAEVHVDSLQGHYLKGIKLTGEGAETQHFTKVKIAIRDETQEGAPDIGAVAARPRRPAPVTPVAPSALEELRRAARESAEAATAASGAPDPVGDFGGLRLRSWRVHPRAARLARVSRLGWVLYPPLDLDVLWRGGRQFEWKALTPFGDEEVPALEALAARSGDGVRAYAPPRKLDFGVPGDGDVAIWTGLVLETPPGWALEVRSLPGGDPAGIFAVEPEVLDTDRGPRDLTLRLKIRHPDRWVHLRGADPATAQPIAHLAPVSRVAFEAEWLLGQMPIEASKDAADVLRRWSATRP